MDSPDPKPVSPHAPRGIAASVKAKPRQTVEWSSLLDAGAVARAFAKKPVSGPTSEERKNALVRKASRS